MVLSFTGVAAPESTLPEAFLENKRAFFGLVFFLGGGNGDKSSYFTLIYTLYSLFEKSNIFSVLFAKKVELNKGLNLKTYHYSAPPLPKTTIPSLVLGHEPMIDHLSPD